VSRHCSARVNHCFNNDSLVQMFIIKSSVCHLPIFCWQTKYGPFSIWIFLLSLLFKPQTILCFSHPDNSLFFTPRTILSFSHPDNSLFFTPGQFLVFHTRTILCFSHPDNSLFIALQGLTILFSCLHTRTNFRSNSKFNRYELYRHVMILLLFIMKL